MSKRATAKDVAAIAGVSSSAVYNFASRPHLNSTELNARISQAAAELGYNPVGRTSARQEARLRVGMEVHRTPDNVNSGIYAPLLIALMDEVESRGGRIVPFMTHGDSAERREAYQRVWRGGDVDAFVVEAISSDDGEPLETLNELNAPFVMFGRPLAHELKDLRQPFGWVEVDNRQGMRLAVNHLFASGHRFIAYLGPSPSVDSDTEDRWRGYEEAMLLSGLEPRRVDAGYGETLSTLRPRLNDLLTSEVTAVAAFNDDLAVELMRSAMTIGRRIGGDASNSELAVVGFDNTEKAHIGLTSVRQPIEEISRHLVIALLETIRNRDRPHHVVLSCDLVVRDSTAKAVAIT